MTTEKATMEIEVIYSEDQAHRYLIKRTWDASLPHACVVMLSPSRIANTIAMDMTSMYTINNCHRQGFGSMSIVNIFSSMEDKEFESTQENDEMLSKTFKEADKIVLAWGKGSTTKKTMTRLNEVYKLLTPYKKRLVEISDGEDSGFHPLGRTVRLQWKLVPAELPKSDTK